jgi:hypothetical protein
MAFEKSTPSVSSTSLESENLPDTVNMIDTKCMPDKAPLCESWNRDEYDFAADSEMSIDCATEYDTEKGPLF